MKGVVVLCVAAEGGEPAHGTGKHRESHNDSGNRTAADIRLRVAAYARVSSSSDEQLNSFAAQNRYYTELISGKDNWQLVDIYADEAVIIGLKI